MLAVLFDSEPPGEESTSLRLQAAGAQVVSARPSPMDEWALLTTHERWGVARIVAPRPSIQAEFLPAPWLLALLPDLTPDEVATIGGARTMRAVMLADGSAGGLQALRDRKRLLRFTSAVLCGDGLGALDVDAQRVWSPAELDDELAHDADLDIHGLFGLHAVTEGGRTTWLHTHGLAAVGAFDFDILNPSPALSSPGVEAIPSIAFAILEGAVSPNTPRYPVAWPGGELRFVPVRTFDAKARDEDRGGRTLDAVEDHVDDRVVLCEPVGLLGRLFGRRLFGHHAPSAFLSREVPDGTVWLLSAAATECRADRARRTYPVLQRLHGELAPVVGPPLVKLGYEAADGGREHLWFEVHRLLDDRLEATLLNEPHAVPSLRKGQRGEHAVERLGDWLLGSPLGTITPRSQAVARRIRAELPRLRGTTGPATGA
ncbi:MAG: DUF2314 domain-containing protein [Planctomycetes bacterium]|nr:DUF2314 domain-containing protein [Planctomycetota bacterium]